VDSSTFQYLTRLKCVNVWTILKTSKNISLYHRESLYFVSC